MLKKTFSFSVSKTTCYFDASFAQIGSVVEDFAREPNGGLVVLSDLTTNAHRDLITRWRRGTACRHCTSFVSLSPLVA